MHKKNKDLLLEDLRQELAEAKAVNKRLLNYIEKNSTYETTQGNKYSILNTVRKEFAEKLKKKVHNYYPSIDSYCTSRQVILVKDIDELLKEYYKNEQ